MTRRLLVLMLALALAASGVLSGVGAASASVPSISVRAASALPPDAATVADSHSGAKTRSGDGPDYVDGPDYTANCPQRPAAGTYTCYSLRRTDRQAPTTERLATVAGYGPADLHSAYALPALTAGNGSGQTVYVIDAFGYPNAEADLAQYRSTYHLPSCTSASGCFKKYNQAGRAGPLPAYNGGWAAETALDLDVVSAVCPKCHITLIEADDNSDNLFRAVKQANVQGAKYISMSWGGPEAGDQGDYDAQYFYRPGVVYAASSGDGGYADGASYPSTSTNVVAVGGTTLTKANNTRKWAESTWGNSDGAPGSGCSAVESKPAWQRIVAGSVCTNRAGNDVAAVADPGTGVAVYQKGSSATGWSITGGTSASAPLITSVYALAANGTPATSPVSSPYANASSLNDVTTGDNGSCSPALLCTAAVGWDGPTGLGTPKGITAFARPSQAVAITNPDDQASKIGAPVAGLQVRATDTPTRTLTYSATGLPAGLTISTTGRITGTPTTRGASKVRVSASDGTAGSSAIFTWRIADAATYLPVPSNRLLDTRYGIGAGKAPVGAKSTVSLQVLGRGGVPSSGVSAVVLNVTATAPAAPGYVTVFASGTTRPTVSNVNFVAGRTVPNLVIAKVGADGKVDLYASAATHLVADVNGFYLDGTPGSVVGSFAPVPPTRVLDTRDGTGGASGPVAAGSATYVEVAAGGAVPADATAVVLNVTAVSPVAAGHLSVFPDGTAVADARKTSTLNYTAGASVAVPALTVVPLPPDGRIGIYTVAGTQLVADVFGYFTGPASASATAGGAYTPVTATRLLDTRSGSGPVGDADGVLVSTAGKAGIPSSGVSAVVLNVTVTDAAGSGFVIAFAADQGLPLASNLNFVKGQTVANLVVVPVSSAGQVALVVGTTTGTVDLIADVVGYYRA